MATSPTRTDLAISTGLGYGRRLPTDAAETSTTRSVSSTEYVYLLGLYLGDGAISEHRRRVFRLRIALDVKYPGIVDECAAAMRRSFR